MTCTNQIVRFALSDPSGVTGFSISSKVEAGAAGLLVRGSTEVGGICTDYSGNLYISDAAQHCIIKVDEGGRVSNFAGTPGTSGNDAAWSRVANNSAHFDTPKGICCDKSGNIYVADSGNHKIRVISGGYVNSVAGASTGVSGKVDGSGATARFYSPTGICVDATGTLYVADTDNNCVRKISPRGDVLTIAGNIATGAAGDAENVEANGQTAMFTMPLDVAVDAEGNVYVLDTGNHKIKKIVPRGWVYLHSGSGTAGTSLGTGTTKMYTCQYNELSYCDMDRSGHLYVVDWSENATRLLSLDYNGNPSEIADFAGTSEVQCPVAVAVTPGQKVMVTLSGYQEGMHSSSSSTSESSESSSSSTSESSSSSSTSESSSSSSTSESSSSSSS